MDGFEVLLALNALNVLLVVWIYARRYAKVPPNKAMVCYGAKGEQGANWRVVPPGGGKFIYPLLESREFLPLEARRFFFPVGEIPTKSDAPVTVELTTLFRISPEPSKLGIAARTLLRKSSAEINELAALTLSRHVRYACGRLSVERIHAGRESLARDIRNRAEADFGKLGLDILALVVYNVADHAGLIEARGKKRLAEVKATANEYEEQAKKETWQVISEWERLGSVPLPGNAAAAGGAGHIP